MAIRTPVAALISLFFLAASSCMGLAQEATSPKEGAPQPITVNGETVEYQSNNKDVTATGNVEVSYKGSVLTCDKLTVNTQTKDGLAEGHIRLVDPQGVVEGESMRYNFQNKTGVVTRPTFRSSPYFGKAERMDKVSDAEYVSYRARVTTCSMDRPHYRISTKRVNFFPGDKIRTRQDVMFVDGIPVLYLPWYNHSLKDPMMHVQVMPGKKKDWGEYLLTAWRYNLTEHVSGRIYADYRSRLGLAEGFGANYQTPSFGRGDLKYYYTYERPTNLEESQRGEFQRYLVRWRHQWNIDKRTNMVAELYKIQDDKRNNLGPDHNFLKDYFFREYEKDAQPISYALFHHNFDYSSLDVLLQKRFNRWYGGDPTGVEKLPEITYTLPAKQLGRTPFYLENNSSYVNYNLKTAAAPADSSTDVTYNQVSTRNKFSVPTRVSFLRVTPFVSGTQTYNDKGTYGSTLDVVFAGGSEVSTKFYRLFDVNTNALGLDINGLRHIITPLATYTYTSDSLMPSSHDRFGGGATAGRAVVDLELTNRLQTKRKDESGTVSKVDLATLKVNSSYIVKPETGERRGSTFSDFLFDLELRPYSWMRFDADATYTRSGLDDDPTNPQYKHFSNANYDFSFSPVKAFSFGMGQRYQRKGSNELTASFNWRITPKWEFGIYERYNFKQTTTIKRGLREQQYTLSRDLHCWIMDFTYSIKQEEGHSIWIAFRLKAFPEMEFGFDQSYHQPKSGSQN